MLARTLAALLAIVFLVFGGLKLQDMHGFVGNVENFQLPPLTEAPFAVGVAYLLVPLEILVGVCLLFRWWQRGAALLSLGMIVSFIIGIASVWARGLNIECGCAGERLSLGGYPAHMGILAVMLAANVYLIVELAYPTRSQQEL